MTSLMLSAAPGVLVRPRSCMPRQASQSAAFGVARRRPARADVKCAARADGTQPLEMQALGKNLAGDLEGTSIFLIGMMGCGKTTVGKLVAQGLGYIFVDTDAVIAAAAKKDISTIFDEDSEEGFREAESDVLNEVSSYGKLVVSTGGGVVTTKANWGHLHNGIVVYLKAPPAVLARRVTADKTAKRPLLAGAPAGGEVAFAQGRLEALLKERSAMYEQADVTVSIAGGDGGAEDGGEAAPGVVAERVLRALAKRLAESDTKQRLHRAPKPGSVELEGGRATDRI